MGGPESEHRVQRVLTGGQHHARRPLKATKACLVLKMWSLACIMFHGVKSLEPVTLKHLS